MGVIHQASPVSLVLVFKGDMIDAAKASSSATGYKGNLPALMKRGPLLETQANLARVFG